MTPLATIKHVSSKNANYGDAESYLTFEHDEFSGKALRDKNGHLIPREEYRMDTLLCGEDDFAIACMRANLRYNKNNLRGDVRSHHYIISYDPRDSEEHGLTIDQAQKMGVEFCRKNFPGHQAIIVTHPDGHNRSGNIHTHIVINSLRIEDVPLMPYMDKSCDTKAGMKHRCTSACFRHLRSEVMEMCQENGLYQIDLLGGSKDRVTDKEHWIQRRGQQKLDENAGTAEQVSADNRSGNTALIAENPAKPSKYETDKEKLRNIIRSAMSRADSMESFERLLGQQGITVKESRGRFSYLSSDRTKPITDRKLGNDFLKDAVLEQLAKNARLGSDSGRMEMDHAIPDRKLVSPLTVTEPIPVRKEKPAAFEKAKEGKKQVERIIDLGKKMEEGKGEGYRQWGTLFNLKQLAESMNYLSNHGIKNYQELEARLTDAMDKSHDLNQRIKVLETQIKDMKTFQKQILQYRSNRAVFIQWQNMKNGKQRDAFYEARYSEIAQATAAADYFRAHEIKSPLPSPKKLQAEIDDLISRKADLYAEYKDAKKIADELMTVKYNIDEASRMNPEHQQRNRQKRHGMTR